MDKPYYISGQKRPFAEIELESDAPAAVLPEVAAVVATAAKLPRVGAQEYAQQHYPPKTEKDYVDAIYRLFPLPIATYIKITDLLFSVELSMLPSSIRLYILDFEYKTLRIAYFATANVGKRLIASAIRPLLGRFKGDSERRVELLFRTLLFECFAPPTDILNLKDGLLLFAFRRIRFLEYDKRFRQQILPGNILVPVPSIEQLFSRRNFLYLYKISARFHLPLGSTFLSKKLDSLTSVELDDFSRSLPNWLYQMEYSSLRRISIERYTNYDDLDNLLRTLSLTSVDIAHLNHEVILLGRDNLRHIKRLSYGINSTTASMAVLSNFDGIEHLTIVAHDYINFSGISRLPLRHLSARISNRSEGGENLLYCPYLTSLSVASNSASESEYWRSVVISPLVSRGQLICLSCELEGTTNKHIKDWVDTNKGSKLGYVYFKCKGKISAANWFRMLYNDNLRRVDFFESTARGMSSSTALSMPPDLALEASKYISYKSRLPSF